MPYCCQWQLEFYTRQGVKEGKLETIEVNYSSNKVKCFLPKKVVLKHTVNNQVDIEHKRVQFFEKCIELF